VRVAGDNSITTWYLASLPRPAGRAIEAPCELLGTPNPEAAVTGFLGAIGYDTVDAGPVASGGRRFRSGTGTDGPDLA
jgi:hypothetical protein